MYLKNGIYVEQVERNSPAYNAGLKEGDILEKIDDVNLNKMSDLRKYLYSKQAGEKVKITYLRNNREALVEITLAK